MGFALRRGWNTNTLAKDVEIAMCKPVDPAHIFTTLFALLVVIATLLVLP